jgi:hypothetical protein
MKWTLMNMTTHKSDRFYGTTKETNLCSRTSEVRTKHNNPGGLVREFLSACLEAILEEFEVTTAAVATLLVFDLVLDDKRLVRNVKGLLERSRNGMVGRDTLCNETVVTLDYRGRSFLDRPFADIREDFTTNRSLLSSLRRGPPVFPAFGKLFDKRSLDFGGL